MAISIGDVVEVVVQSKLFEQQLMTVLHYVVGQAPTQQDQLVSQQDIIDLLNAGGTFDIITKYKQCLGNNATITGLTAQYIFPVRWRRTREPLSVAGTSGANAVTANTSAMVIKYSAKAGKKNRGAIHMPALPGAALDDGNLNFGYVTDLNDLATQLEENLLEAGGAGRWDPWILHRTVPLNGTGVVWEAHDIPPTIRVQRRRTLGVGK